MNFQQFRGNIKKHRKNLKIQGVRARWPYDYNNNRGYIVTMNNNSIYFYFNNDGKLLAKGKA